jgi:predicted DsbA family dithiol-disulfide isomerase
VEVEKLIRDYDVEVNFAPFFLDPTIPPEGRPRKPMTNPDDPPSHLELRAQASGLQMTRGRTFTPNSHLSLQAAEFAAEHGDPMRFHRRMFKAFFEDLENVGDIDVCVRIGEEAGLDGAALRKALEEGTYREIVDEGIAWSRGIGVTGVPTFVFEDKWAIVGAQDYPVFQSIMEQLGKTPRTNGTSAGEAGDEET